MFQSRQRTYRASVFFGDLPKHQVDLDGQLLNPGDKHLWAEIIKQAKVVIAKPDTTYKRNGEQLLIKIPDGCDYWIDGKRLIIVRKGTLCKECPKLFKHGNCKRHAS